MRKIIKIDFVQELRDKQNKRYFRTYAVLDDGTEAVGFGKDFDLGDKVQVFLHYGVIKMRKPIDK